MRQNFFNDWRVIDGPAIGAEPEFAFSDVRLNAGFHARGTMSRDILAALTATTPTIVETSGRALTEFLGLLRIFDSHPARTYPGLYARHFDSAELGLHRGALAIPSPGHFAVHLYLPSEQFALLLPLLSAPGVAGRLRIEIDRTLNEGLFDEESHFWNDRISPVILFDAFDVSIGVPEGPGSAEQLAV